MKIDERIGRSGSNNGVPNEAIQREKEDSRFDTVGVAKEKKRKKKEKVDAASVDEINYKYRNYCMCGIKQ